MCLRFNQYYRYISFCRGHFLFEFAEYNGSNALAWAILPFSVFAASVAQTTGLMGRGRHRSMYRTGRKTMVPVSGRSIPFGTCHVKPRYPWQKLVTSMLDACQSNERTRLKRGGPVVTGGGFVTFSVAIDIGNDSNVAVSMLACSIVHGVPHWHVPNNMTSLPLAPRRGV